MTRVLAMAALAGVLIMGAGCSSSRELQIRPPTAMETARLLKNAHYYKLMGRPEASLKEMEQAHRQDPDNLKIVDALAQSYQELGRFQRAQELYQEALSRHASNRGLRNNWCFSFYLQGNLTKAETCFQEALARDPGNTAARNNLGLLWCRQGKLGEAQRLWEEAEGAAAAQKRLNQALAYLGKSPPAHYAKAAEPKSGPAPQAATPAKPAAPLAPAAPPKPVVAEAKPAVKAPVPAQPAAVPPKAEVRVAAKAAEAKPTPLPQATTPAKPAAPLAPAAPAKPVALEAKPPVKAPVPAQPVAAAPKTEMKKAAQPAAPSPFLTLAEREAGIELRNGNGIRNLARSTEATLSQEGFNVVQIGNHIDFGAEATVIYYRDGAQRLAQALNSEIFPEAKLEPSAKLQAGVAVKVLLGRDLLNQPLVMARLTGETLAKASPALKAKAPETGPRPQAGASPRPAALISGAAPAKAQPDKPSVKAPATAGKPTPTQTAVATAAPKRPLTAEELISTKIEIRNGTRSHNLAHRTRSLLSQEGFNVGIIGNHIDFGAEATVIYYRPEAKRVAQALNSEFFPRAQLAPSSRLNHGMAVKVVLGSDLLDRTQLLSMLKE